MLLTRDETISTWERILLTRVKSISTWERIISTWEETISTWERIILTRVKIISTWERIFLTRDKAILTWEATFLRGCYNYNRVQTYFFPGQNYSFVGILLSHVEVDIFPPIYIFFFI